MNTPKWRNSTILSLVYADISRIHVITRWQRFWTCVPQVQVMSVSLSMVQHTRTTVLWPWRTLVEVVMLCCVWLTELVVADLLILVKRVLPWGTGSFQMEPEFLAVLLIQVRNGGISTEQEIRVWYVCTGGEVVWLEFTAVKYLMQLILPKRYILEYIQQTLVSGI